MYHTHAVSCSSSLAAGGPRVVVDGNVSLDVGEGYAKSYSVGRQTNDPRLPGRGSGDNSSTTGQNWTYHLLRELGRGTFGKVVLAQVMETGEKVAIKRVRYDSSLHNRELLIMRDVLDASVKDTEDSNGVKAGQAPVKATSELAGPQSDDTPSQDKHPSLHYHPNVVQLRNYFFTEDVAAGESYLHIVMSYLPTDLQSLRCPEAGVLASGGRPGTVAIGTSSEGRRFPLIWVKVVLFQLARALVFLHLHHVCHRDLKPANVLVDPITGRVQLCDFGSAKQIRHQHIEKNVSYICSRYYRAPELLCGSLHYGCEVDMWSLGCIAAELLRDDAHVLFKGCTTVDQLAEVFKVLGAPSAFEMHAMNPQCAEAMRLTHADYYPAQHETESDGYCTAPDDSVPSEASCSTSAPRSDYFEHYDVLKIKAMQWERVFPRGTPVEAVQMISQLLCYLPLKRLSAVAVVEHPFFNELFPEDSEPLPRLPNGHLMPAEMFLLTSDEQRLYSASLQGKLSRIARRMRDVARNSDDNVVSELA